MTKERYEDIIGRIEKKQGVAEGLRLLNAVLTVTVYISYPALCLYLLIFRRELLLRCVLVPGIMFVCVSLLRRVINRPRPYEKLGFTPVIFKDKKGQSMPSRHVFSVFIIAMTFLYVFPSISAVFFIIGFIMAAVRVLGGVHYLSDVLVGAAVGVASGIIGFYII